MCHCGVNGASRKHVIVRKSRLQGSCARGLRRNSRLGAARATAHHLASEWPRAKRHPLLIIERSVCSADGFEILGKVHAERATDSRRSQLAAERHALSWQGRVFVRGRIGQLGAHRSIAPVDLVRSLCVYGPGPDEGMACLREGRQECSAAHISAEALDASPSRARPMRPLGPASTLYQCSCQIPCARVLRGNR